MNVVFWLLAGIGVFGYNLHLAKAKGRRHSVSFWAVSFLVALVLGPIPVVISGAVVTVGFPAALLLGFFRDTAR